MGFGGGFSGGSGKVGTDQEVSGTIHISEEQASTPDAPTDSGGILYVKSGDPTKVYYRGKGGSETDLTATGGGGGGGGGIAMDGSTGNGILTRHTSTTASVESNLTFDGSSNVLTVTGQVTASVGLSGAAGQFGSLTVAGSALGSMANAATGDYAALAGATFTGDVVGTQISASTGLSGAAGQFGTATVGGAELVFNTVTGAAPTNGSILRVFDGGSMTDNAYLIMHRNAADEPGLQARGPSAAATNLQGHITELGGTGGLTTVTASVSVSASAGLFGTISLDGDDLQTTLGGKASSTATTTIGSSTVTLGSTTSTIEGLTTLTASNIQVTNLDVVTINSVSQTETTLEIDDKLIISAVSASSTDASGGGLQIGGGQDVTGHASVLWDNASQTLKIVSGSVDALHVGTSVSSSLNMSASAFYGDGANLQNIDAPKLGGQNSAYHLDLGNSTGTLSLDRLPATLTASVLSGTTAVSGAAGQFGTITGDGSTITNIDADNISAGTLNNSRLPTTIDQTIIKASDGFFHGVTTSDHKIHIKSTGDASIWLEADSDNNSGGEGDNAFIKLSQDNGAVVGYMGFTSASLDPGGAAYTDVTDNALLIGTTDEHSELQFGLNSAVIMTLRNTGRVGIGTNNPQHSFDVPDMGGMILAYNQITGSRDGTGNEVLIALRSTNYRTTTNWAVQHETSNPTDGSQLKLTFTMPASGRAEISVPSGLITTQPHTGDSTGGAYDGTWWGPDTSDVEAALTASGYSGNEVDWQSRQAAVMVSLSTNSSSYDPAGPRSEFEHLVDWRGNNNLSYNRRFAVPSWVMTGAAGSSHTVYLAFCNDGNASTRIMTLAYGGTGSADINAPGFGPIVMKAVSLPSTS